MKLLKKIHKLQLLLITLIVIAAIFLLAGCASQTLSKQSNNTFVHPPINIPASSQSFDNNPITKGKLQQMIDNIKVEYPTWNDTYNRQLWSGKKPPEITYMYNNHTYHTHSLRVAMFYNTPYLNHTSGLWTDPYTAQTQQCNVPIINYKNAGCRAASGKGIGATNWDHIIPIRYINREIGGDDVWSAQKREQFYYDISVGVVVSAKQNDIKGDKGPSNYLPPDNIAKIKYCYTWLVIANKYHIPIAPQDMTVIKDVMEDATIDEIQLINK